MKQPGHLDDSQLCTGYISVSYVSFTEEFMAFIHLFIHRFIYLSIYSSIVKKYKGVFFFSMLHL